MILEVNCHLWGSALPSPGWYNIIPEGDKSDNACYQVPADIADNKFTDNTTLQVRVGGVDFVVPVHLQYTSSSSLLSLQVLEGPWASSRVILESMSLKYEPASVPQHISVKWLLDGADWRRAGAGRRG